MWQPEHSEVFTFYTFFLCKFMYFICLDVYLLQIAGKTRCCKANYTTDIPQHIIRSYCPLYYEEHSPYRECLS